MVGKISIFYDFCDLWSITINTMDKLLSKNIYVHILLTLSFSSYILYVQNAWGRLVTLVSEQCIDVDILQWCSWSSKADRLILSMKWSTVHQYETVRPRRRRRVPCSRVRMAELVRRSPAESGASVSPGMVDRRANSVSVFTRLTKDSFTPGVCIVLWSHAAPRSTAIQCNTHLRIWCERTLTPKLIACTKWWWWWWW